MSLEQIRDQLLARQAELEGRLARVEEHVSHRNDPLSADFAEQAVERENDEVLEAIGCEVSNELAQIKQSLRRIEAGSYGHCERCGEDIAIERLNIVPYTAYCIRCAVG
ncbi:TraR/DksA family transcriptional regulator [Pseudoteredinibacter isoporae]|uniref:TraR/DksA family transcriptional regulator n=1 Tax=Pseudoteredinibacter isoporae TaxID=570281 RepID=UPI0031048E22